MRVEQGGTTGALDREIAEKEENGKAIDTLANALTREHTGITVQQHSKRDDSKSEYMITYVYKCMYISRRCREDFRP